MNQENQLAVRTPMPFEEMEKMAKAAAESGMFGITKPAQALCLFAICQSEGMDPISALRRYHIVENKPSMRADAMAADFIKQGGAILWHVRTDGICAATFFADKSKLDDAARARAIQRFDKLWEAESSDDDEEITRIVIEVSKLAVEGEETIIRTYADAEEKGLTKSWRENPQTKEKELMTKKNWDQSPRQMLTARVITEGVRLVAPGLIAGVYSPEEVQDIVRDEHEFIEATLIDSSKDRDRIRKERDRSAMEEMIKTYLLEAETAKGERKQELLGLAAELRVKLADMDLKDDEIPGIAPAQPKDSAFPVASEPELHLAGEEGARPIPWREYALQHVKSKVLRGKKLGVFSPEDIRTIFEKSAYALVSPDPKIRAEAHYIKEANDELNPKEKP